MVEKFYPKKVLELLDDKPVNLKKDCKSTGITVEENNELRKSGLTEAESREYKILSNSKHSPGGDEFELEPEDEARIRELEEKMQKHQE